MQQDTQDFSRWRDFAIALADEAAERARTIGWKPKHADILGTIKAEVELQWSIAQKNGGEVDFTFERNLAKLFGFA